MRGSERLRRYRGDSQLNLPPERNPMLNIFARASISKVIAPLGKRLADAGVTADAVTVVGTTGAVGAALGFFSQGIFFVGTLVIWFFVMLDMVDGAVARAGGVSSK